MGMFIKIYRGITDFFTFNNCKDVVEDMIKILNFKIREIRIYKCEIVGACPYQTAKDLSSIEYTKIYIDNEKHGKIAIYGTVDLEKFGEHLAIIEFPYRGTYYPEIEFNIFEKYDNSLDLIYNEIEKIKNLQSQLIKSNKVRYIAIGESIDDFAYYADAKEICFKTMKDYLRWIIQVMPHIVKYLDEVPDLNQQIYDDLIKFREYMYISSIIKDIITKRERTLEYIGKYTKNIATVSAGSFIVSHDKSITYTLLDTYRLLYQKIKPIKEILPEKEIRAKLQNALSF